MILASFIKRIMSLNIKNVDEEKIDDKTPENILENPSSKIGLIINFFVIFLIIISIGFIIFESIGNNNVEYKKILYISDGIISTLFAIEYFYRLFYARRKIKFLFKIMNVVDLLAFTPFFLEIIFVGMIDIGYLKALRILRIFRIFKLVRHFKSIGFIVKGLKSYKEEYQVGAILVVIVLLISSILMYHVEGKINPGFSSIPQSMRWGIVTMATVGYGDVYPTTLYGKILGGIIILIGPMVIAMISSITVLVFFEVAENNKNSKIQKKLLSCPRCKNNNNLHDSNYCRICGEKMDNNNLK